jgi:tetratricopeptide (TPR) repeat protein
MTGEGRGAGAWFGVALVVAVATGLIGTAGVLFGGSGGGGKGRAEAAAAREAAEKAEAAAGEARARADEAAAAARRAEESAASLAARVAVLEAAPRAGSSGGGAGAGGAPGADAAASSESGKAPDAALVAEYQALRRKVFRGQATPEEQRRFFELLKSPGFLDGLLADLEGKVAAAPGDPDARLALADGYISKLFTVPAGPEMGVWGAKAEDQWKEILKQDDRHWQARYSLAFSWSQYPDFLNRTPDALREFEKLRGQQEQVAAEPRHASTYFHLHALYRKAGNPEKAREALEEGLRRFPEDADLKKVQETVGR